MGRKPQGIKKLETINPFCDLGFSGDFFNYWHIAISERSE
jgi:hypothetical protein